MFIKIDEELTLNTDHITHTKMSVAGLTAVYFLSGETVQITNEDAEKLLAFLTAHNLADLE